MRTLFLLLAFFFGYCSFAQITVGEKVDNSIDNEEFTIIEEEQTVDNIEPLPDSDLEVPEAWYSNFDDLLNSWYVRQHTNKMNRDRYQENIPACDSVLIERLSGLPNIIEMPFNEIVGRCISMYVDRRRDLVEYMLGLEYLYFPMIEETLEKYELPLEIKYLVIVESAMNPMAFSRAGASGLWQFILSTGKMYGLEINSLIDERRDPLKSTDAACRFLKDLYGVYGDWHLALAAYNCGGANVNKAIRRAGGKKDFWAIYPYLPRETRSYVPLFIAANYVMNYYHCHQLYPVQRTRMLATDTVMINQMIHFDQIAEVLQMDKELLRSLNPQYKRDIIPGNYKPQALNLPTAQTYEYVEKEYEIATHRIDELFTNRAYVDEKTAASRQEKITHKVTSGESVLTIANRYGVTAPNIRKWNGLRSNSVAAGKNLILYVDNGGVRLQNTNANTAVKSTTASSARPQNSSLAATANSSSDDTVLYKVQPNDTYSRIAQKYPGYSSADLMKLNNTTSSALKTGQYILVPNI